MALAAEKGEKRGQAGTFHPMVCGGRRTLVVATVSVVLLSACVFLREIEIVSIRGTRGFRGRGDGPWGLSRSDGGYMLINPQARLPNEGRTGGQPLLILMVYAGEWVAILCCTFVASKVTELHKSKFCVGVHIMILL